MLVTRMFFRLAFHLRQDAANATDDHFHLDAGLGGLPQLLNQIQVGNGIELQGRYSPWGLLQFPGQ